jgi:hypothetical protein
MKAKKPYAKQPNRMTKYPSRKTVLNQMREKAGVKPYYRDKKK